MSQAPLTGRTLRALAWTLSGSGFQVVGQVATLFILARLLTPEHFGLVGMAMVVTGLSTVFAQLGIGPALVQLRNIRPDHVASAHTASILLGLATTAVFWAAAGWMEQLSGMPGLAPIVRALSITFAIEGVSVVGEALLQRRLEFRRLAKIGVVSHLAGYGAVGVIGAVAGLGAWALVAAHLGQSFIKAALVLACTYRGLTLGMRRSALAELLSFGGVLSAGNVFGYVAVAADKWIVGRVLGTASLGLYDRAYKVMVFPANLFAQAVDRVLFPTVALVQNEPARLGVAYRRVTAVTAMVGLPLTAVALLLAPEIVRVLLGPAWSAAVPVLQILSAGVFLRVGLKVGDTFARATGATRGILACKMVFAALVVGGAVYGSRWGLTGVATGVLAALLLTYISFAALGAWATGLGPAALVRCHLSGVVLGIAGGASALAVLAPLRAAGTPALLRLTLAPAAAAAAVGLLLWLLPPRYTGVDTAWLSGRVRDAIMVLKGRLWGAPGTPATPLTRGEGSNV